MTTKTKISTFADVFSEPERILKGVASWQDVSRLGSKNIHALFKRVCAHNESIGSERDEILGRYGVLHDKSGDDFKKMAEGFQNPTITKVGIPTGSLSGDLEPLDAASKNREAGSTTFNICGWCKYSSGGDLSGQYQFVNRASCSLLSDPSLQTRFNTPCLLQTKSRDQLAIEARHLSDEVGALMARRRKVCGGIDFLERLKGKKTEEKLLLMSLRSSNHFNLGDEVMVYIGQWGSSKRELDGVWAPAIVIPGYRHHGGNVNYQALVPVHTDMSKIEGCGGSAFFQSPRVLLRSEFDYLRRVTNSSNEGDAHFVGMWLNNFAGDLGRFDTAQFLHDLTSGKIAWPPAER